MASVAANIRYLREKMHLTQQQLAEKIGRKRVNISAWEIGNGKPKYEDATLLASALGVSVEDLYNGDFEAGEVADPNYNKHYRETSSPGDDMRKQKAFGDTDEGITYVPRAAQAGYSKHYNDPLYINQLKRWRIPDFPYKGDKYRIFQVEGDSMQYEEGGYVKGLLDGMEVVGELVEPEYWHQSTQWYIHVIVFDDSLVIKRLYREEGGKTFILISDNPHYPQRRVHIEDIRELWIMKRYLGWDMAPPKKYDIVV